MSAARIWRWLVGGTTAVPDPDLLQKQISSLQGQVGGLASKLARIEARALRSVPTATGGGAIGSDTTSTCGNTGGESATGPSECPTCGRAYPLSNAERQRRYRERRKREK